MGTLAKCHDETNSMLYKKIQRSIESQNGTFLQKNNQYTPIAHFRQIECDVIIFQANSRQ